MTDFTCTVPMDLITNKEGKLEYICCGEKAKYKVGSWYVCEGHKKYYTDVNKWPAKLLNNEK